MTTPSATALTDDTLSNTSEPPPLNYTLRTRKLSISIFWFLILVDAIAVPIALYYGLWYHTSLSHNAGMFLRCVAECIGFKRPDRRLTSAIHSLQHQYGGTR